MTILVTGATGNIGRLVAGRLVEEGEHVRALTRDPGKAAKTFPEAVEVVQGDLSEPAASLPGALRGVDRVYLFPVPETARQVVELAGDAGVRRVVVLSSGAVTGGYDTEFHLPVEQAVEASGLEWTHVRAGEFMLNKLWLWGPSIRAERVVRDPNPEVAWCPVHERDVADVAVTALLKDGHAGTAYDLNGPGLISYRDQVRAIAEALGEEIRFEKVTPQAAREFYKKQGGFAAENADFLLGFTDYSGGEADPSGTGEDPSGTGEDPSGTGGIDLEAGGLPTSEAVTGVPARTFAEWAREHADGFR